MFIVRIDRAWNDDSNGGLIVIVDLNFGQNPNLECRFGARHSDCRGRFTSVDWQRIDIWPWNCNQSIERNERIRNHYSSP